MAKNKEQAKKVQAPAEQPEVNNNTPVSTPSKVVQLTPIIQPIAFVPYSTQEQPLYMYDEEYDYEDDVYEEEIVEAPAAPQKKVSVASIFLILFSLVIIGIYVAAKWVLTEYLALIDGVSGLDMIINMIQGQDFTNIMAICALIVPVMCVLTIISCLIRIKHKGACVFAQITTVIALFGALVVIIMALISKDSVVGYGLYAVAGVSLVNVLIALLSPKQ